MDPLDREFQPKFEDEAEDVDDAEDEDEPKTRESGCDDPSIDEPGPAPIILVLPPN
jgi:hypothetical protein